VRGFRRWIAREPGDLARWLVPLGPLCAAAAVGLAVLLGVGDPLSLAVTLMVGCLLAFIVAFVLAEMNCGTAADPDTD
jgi:hypothetical protein